MALITFHRENEPFQAPKELKLPLLLCLLAVGISGLITVTTYSSTQPQVPLFYSLSNPDQQLVPKQWLFFFPILSALILILHRIFIYFLRKQDEKITKMFTWITLFLLCFLNFGLLRILFVIH